MAVMRGSGPRWIVAYWQLGLAIAGSITLLVVMFTEGTSAPVVGSPSTWERSLCH